MQEPDTDVSEIEKWKTRSMIQSNIEIMIDSIIVSVRKPSQKKNTFSNNANVFQDAT